MEKFRQQSTSSRKAKPGTKNGIRAEDIKTCDNPTKEMIKLIFNEVLKQQSYAPEISRRTRIESYPQKKGTKEDVGNYRPICILPALFKLFSTILYSRFYPRLDQIQSEDQGGFPRSHQAIDHEAPHRMIEQKCHEWRVKMSIATIDFMKACDSFNHNSLWDAVTICCIEHEYISFSKRFFK